MKTNLIVTDPLAGQEVSIMVTVDVCEDGEVCLPRDERPSLLSVGVAGQMPISRSGTFGDMPALINEAWTAFGVRAEMETRAVKTATSTQLSTGTSTQLSTGVDPIAAEEIVAEAAVMPAIDEVDALPSAVSMTKPVTPKRPVSRLSLF